MYRAALVLLFSLVPGVASAKVAFVGLTGLGLERTMVEPIEKMIEGELSRASAGDVLGPSEVRASLVAEGLERLRDCVTLPCLEDLASLVGADLVVWGTLAGLGDSSVVNLRALDLLAGHELPGVKVNLRGDPDVLVEIVRRATSEILAVDRYRGKLSISVSRDDAVVLLDGAEIPRDRWTEIEAAAGMHALVVRAPEEDPFSSMVSVQAGELTELHIPLGDTAAPAGPLRTWLIGSGLVLGGASLGAGGFFAWQVRQIEREHATDFRTRSATDAAHFEDLTDRGKRYALLTNVALAAGGALLSSALIGWLLTGEGSP